MVHLHSAHSVTVSCIADIDQCNVLPPITAYYAMRIGTLPLIPNFKPGDLKLAGAARALAENITRFCWRITGPLLPGPRSKLRSAPELSVSKLR